MLVLFINHVCPREEAGDEKQVRRDWLITVLVVFHGVLGGQLAGVPARMDDVLRVAGFYICTTLRFPIWSFVRHFVVRTGRIVPLLKSFNDNSPLD